MSTAASDGKISMNPCVIRGAGAAKRVKKIRPASLAEIEVITNAMPERYQAMVLLAAWGALRFGELTELRRRDLDLAEGVVRVERAVVRVAGGLEVGTPNRMPVFATWRCRHTYYRLYRSILISSCLTTPTYCCSPPDMADTWHPGRCTRPSIPHGRRLGAKTCAGTIYAIRERFWPPLQALRCRS